MKLVNRQTTSYIKEVVFFLIVQILLFYYLFARNVVERNSQETTISKNIIQQHSCPPTSLPLLANNENLIHEEKQVNNEKNTKIKEEEEVETLTTITYPESRTSFLTKFDLTLKHTIDLHNIRTRKGSPEPPKFLIYQCSRRSCPGWAVSVFFCFSLNDKLTLQMCDVQDRIKGMLNCFLLSLYLNRSLILDANVLYDLGTLYTSDIDWTVRNLRNTGRFNRQSFLWYECMSKNPDCLLSKNYSSSFEIIALETNMDSTGEILREPTMVTKFLEYGLFDDLNWRIKVYNMLFKKPTKLLEDSIKQALHIPLHLPIKYPQIAIQFRVSGSIILNGKKIRNEQQPGDPVVNRDIQISVSIATNCLQKIITENNLLSTQDNLLQLFIGADSQFAIDMLRNESSKFVPIVLSGEEAGELGHIFNNFGKGTHLRLHAEFEIFRNVQYLIAGRSGLPLMAYTVRKTLSMNIYDGWMTCRWPWTFHSTFGWF